MDLAILHVKSEMVAVDTLALVATSWKLITFTICAIIKWEKIEYRK
jgi:hypothetical protein